MFKHLTRISSLKSQIKCAVVLRQPMRQMRQFNSQISADYQSLKSQSPFAASAELLQNNGPRKVVPIPDYEVLNNTQVTKVFLTEEEIREMHPLEHGAKEERKRLEYYPHMEPNQLLLFNLHSSITTEQQVIDLCTEGLRNIEILKVRLQKGLDGKTNSYALVDMAHPKMISKLRDKFKNYWIQDKKIKLKARDKGHEQELAYETYERRTLIVENLPIQYKENDVIELFTTFGSLVSVEMPMKNIEIEEKIASNKDFFNQQKDKKHEMLYNRARKILNESIQQNEEFHETITQYFGKEKADQIMASYEYQPEQEQLLAEALEGQNKFSSQNLFYQLQSEQTEVLKAKRILKSLHAQAQAEVPGLPSAEGSPSLEALKENSQGVQKAIAYLQSNRDGLDEATLSQLNERINLNSTQSIVDPIEKLQSLSRQELAEAYDSLLNALNSREKLIKQRLSEQINHLGIKERILSEDFDFNREQEALRDFRNESTRPQDKIDNILNVTEQVYQVGNFKDESPEDRLYRLLNKSFNPFEDANFNERQLAFASNPDVVNWGKPVVAPDPKMPQSLNRMVSEGYRFERENLERIQGKIELLRNRFDLPFDELYHKERKLIDQVVKATQALKDKEATLPNPFGEDRMASPDMFKNVDERIALEHQYTKEQRLRNEKLLKQSVNEGSNEFSYQVNSNDKIQDLLDSGVLSAQDKDKMTKLATDIKLVNEGYAFVTFSHVDEAKLALICGQHMQAENIELKVSLKRDDVDHKDFDQRYRINTMRNNAQIIDELQRLREARKELREFEDNIDEQLPSLKNMKEFRKVARDVLEDHPYNSRAHETFTRTEQEEADLNEKIRKLQRENPNIDYTQLFDTERAENLRKDKHKKAFASYKAFEFLKHGVETQQQKMKKSEKPEKKKTALESRDPYAFPPLQQTVAMFLTKDSDQIKVIDGGDPLLNKAGRKFGYTERDFIEAYHGKDLARAANVDLTQNKVFGFNDSLKARFPIQRFLQAPLYEAKKHYINEEAGLNERKLHKHEDSLFLRYLQSIDTTQEMLPQDTPHPTDPSRSFLKDLQQRFDQYIDQREKRLGMPLYNTRDLAMMKTKLAEEYMPPKAEQQSDKKDTKQTEKFEPFYEGDQVPAANEAVVESDAPSAPVDKKKSSEGKKGAVVPKIAKPATFAFGFKEDKVSGISFETPLEPERAKMNRDFIYEYKHQVSRKEQADPDFKIMKDLNTKRIESFAKQHGLTNEQVLDGLKDWAQFNKDENMGDFSQANTLGMGKTDKHVENRKHATKSLKEWARAGQDDEDLSEREDEDIYSHYMKQMKEHKKSQTQQVLNEKFAHLKKETENIPDFEGFFKSMSNGKHPFDLEQEMEQDPHEREDELKYDEELYKRELQGRLMGEKLNPRQFEDLYKAKMTEAQQIQFIKDKEREQYIQNRDVSRIFDEQKEMFRKRQIASGECTEENSHAHVSEFVQKILDQGWDDQKFDSFMEQYSDFKHLILTMQNPHSLFEKEYIFDESLGESLQDHVQRIKDEYDNQFEVLVRRDRDGYAIVKTLYKPKYKYDINDVLNFDPVSESEKIKESVEDILKSGMNGDLGKSLLSMDKQQMEQKLIQTMTSANEGVHDFDYETKKVFKSLWQERVNGKYANDREGFTAAFLKAFEGASYEENKRPISTQADIMAEIEKDRDLLIHEVTQQVLLKVKEHMFHKQRTANDLVQPRVSEQSLFDNQVLTNTIGIENLEKTLETGPKENESSFDKEAYLQIKSEIKRRRDAKDKLLKQGFPELKPYLSF